MAENLYPYAVARIHAREKGLLSAAAMEQLLAAKNYEAALLLLEEKGWDISGGEAGVILARQEEETWALIAEMVDTMEPFDVFLCTRDYHNLKAAIKRVTTGDLTEPVFFSRGTVLPQTLLDAVENHDFSLLPQTMREPAQAAYAVMKQTGDGQRCDILLDVAALTALGAAGKASKSSLIARYAELTVAAADIKTAVRCAKMGKNIEFVRRALAPCDSLNTELLARAATSGENAVAEYLKFTPYSSAVETLAISMAAFECWCDNLMIELIRPERTATFGIGPLAGYLLTRQYELASVRMILSGKLNHLPVDAVRERLRIV
ncbi:MAG: V-type ATPase subunit [Pygmaiobacter sp.]